MSIQDALAKVAEPVNPLDGDCIEYSVLITTVLAGVGHPAEQVTIFGWMDHTTRRILFAHYATLTGGDIVDFTARQYHAELPARWIAPAEEYCAELARLSGASRVTVGWV